MVGLYPSTPHDSGLKPLKNILHKRNNQNISIADLIKMTEFLLRNNYFEFNGKVKQQISGTAIGTKSAPTYAYRYMDDFENEFLSLRIYSLRHCGFLEHVSITLIDKTHLSDLLKREDYWRRTLCNMAPYGLNIEDHI